MKRLIFFIVLLIFSLSYVFAENQSGTNNDNAEQSHHRFSQPQIKDLLPPDFSRHISPSWSIYQSRNSAAYQSRNSPLLPPSLEPKLLSDIPNDVSSLDPASMVR